MAAIIAETVIVLGTARPAPVASTTSQPVRTRTTRSSTNLLPETPVNNRAMTMKVDDIPQPQVPSGYQSTAYTIHGRMTFADCPEKVHVLLDAGVHGNGIVRAATIKNSFKVAYSRTLPSEVNMDDHDSCIGVYFFDSQGQASMCYGMGEFIPQNVRQTWLGSAASIDFRKIALVVNKAQLSKSPTARPDTRKSKAGLTYYLDDPETKLENGSVPPLFELRVKNEQMQISSLKKEKLFETILDQKEEEMNAKDTQIDRLDRQLVDYEDHITGLQGKLSHARETYLQPELRALETALNEARDQYLTERRGHQETFKDKQRAAALASRRLSEAIEGRNEERQRHSEEVMKLNARIAALESEGQVLLEENDQLQVNVEISKQEVDDLKDAARVAMDGVFY